MSRLDSCADADVVRVRRTRAGSIQAAFANWLEVQHRSAAPKSLFGQAVGYARNQWPMLVRYLDDSRFAIDNGATERAIRPLALGRANWLHVGGGGGLKTASVLRSVRACATRHRLSPWSYLRDVLDHLAIGAAGAGLSGPLPRTPRHRPGIDSPLETRRRLRTSEPLRPPDADRHHGGRTVPTRALTSRLPDDTNSPLSSPRGV